MTVPHRFTAKQKESIKKDYVLGRTTKEIALRYACGVQTVRRILRALSVQWRTTPPMLGKKHSVETRRKIRRSSPKREKAHAWRGGRAHVQGYVQLLVPTHPKCNSRGYVMEHRLVMEKFLGRYLHPKEGVHHKNGCREDNRLENLELVAKPGRHLAHATCPYCQRSFAVR